MINHRFVAKYGYDEASLQALGGAWERRWNRVPAARAEPRGAAAGLAKCARSRDVLFMRLGDYYRGLPLNLRTPFPPDEVGRRIGGAISSPMWPFATGIVGYASFGRLHLRLRRSLFSYNGMPVLAGPVRAERGGSLLLLKYRGHLATRLAFPLAFLMVGAAVLVYLASGAPSPDIAPWQMALILPVLVLGMALPLGLHAFFIRNAEADFGTLADFLRNRLDAKDVNAPPGWTGG